MKFDKNRIFKKGLKTPFHIFYLVFFMLSSCNSDDGEKAASVQNSTDSTHAKKDDSANEIRFGFYELMLTKAQYENLKDAGHHQTRRILFQFYFSTTDAKYPTLIAYAAKNATDLVKAPTLASQLLVPNGPNLLTKNQYYLGDQEALTKDIDKLIEPAGEADYIILFKPRIDTLNHLSYQIYVPGYEKNKEALYTNPSPPKDAKLPAKK